MLFLVLFALLATSVAGQYDYGEVLHKSILFYEAQRSGWLPDNNRIPWRGDSATGDGDDVGYDLTGGWYDAGDHVKFGFPQAATVTLLAWGMIEFKSGYQAAGEWDNALDCIQWPLDYLRKAHVHPNVLYGQLGDGHVDHSVWGRPEDMTMYRPAWSIWSPDGPGSDLAGETAAAMAASSIVFRDAGDTEYADDLLSRARDLYDLAYDYRGVYVDTIENARDFYDSWSGYNDELCWGAAWLYVATKEGGYKAMAEEFANDALGDRFDWDNKLAGCLLLLHQEDANDGYVNRLTDLLTSWFPGGSVHHTPGGLAWVDQWGPNRYSANMAFLALVAAEKGIQVGTGQNFARTQIGYMLGDHSRSFVVNFGNNPPQRPHHRSSSCPDRPANCDWNDYNNPGPNPQDLTGALVGGPDQDDNYVDDRGDYIANEVAIDYNSGFQGAIAGLITLQERENQ